MVHQIIQYTYTYTVQGILKAGIFLIILLNFLFVWLSCAQEPPNSQSISWNPHNSFKLENEKSSDNLAVRFKFINWIWYWTVMLFKNKIPAFWGTSISHSFVSSLPLLYPKRGFHSWQPLQNVITCTCIYIAVIKLLPMNTSLHCMPWNTLL